MSEFAFKTEPFQHQLETWKESRNRDFFGVFWEQGTGKTKLVLDTAAWLQYHDKINGLLVVAPNGVHRNWITDEINVHYPDFLTKGMEVAAYQSNKAGTKAHQQKITRILRNRGMSLLAMSYEGLMTERGKKTANEFLTTRKVLYALDESSKIKTPKAKRTKAIVASGKWAPYRRIMDGTPITQGAFDIYSPIRFLDEKFWMNRIGARTFSAFKGRYGEFRKGYDPRSGREFQQLVSYKNVDELAEIMQEIGSRILKEDCLDLPEKLYSKRYFQISDRQRSLYEQLKAEFMAELDGELIDAPLAIVRLLRFQQIACGYVATGDENEIRNIDDKNLRLELLKEVIDGIPHQAIIWNRFNYDVDLICDLLGADAARYDGKVSDDDCARAKADFQSGKKQFFVTTYSKGATGLTLTQAKTVINYTHTFKLGDRLQSEDRAHRIGQDQNVHYIDFIAENTVDEHIVNALRTKKNISDQITGDRVKDWL